MSTNGYNGYNGNANYQNAAANKINQLQNQLNQLSNQSNAIQTSNSNFNHLRPQQSPSFNQSTNKTEYHLKALDEIRISLQPFINNERPTSSASSTSEASSNFTNNFKQQQAMFEIGNASNLPNLSKHHLPGYSVNANGNQYVIDSNGQLVNGNGQMMVEHYYKTNGYNSYPSDKQSPTPTISSSDNYVVHKSHPNGGNCNKLSSCSSSQNSYIPSNLFASNNSSTVYLNSKTPKSDLTSPVDDASLNGAQFSCNNALVHDQPPVNLQTAKLQAWSVRQTKSQSPVIMQSVKSTQVQKPILQTACAPIIMNTNQQPQPLINNNSSTTAIVYPQRSLNVQSSGQAQSNSINQLQFNEKSLKTDLVQLNPNITKKFLNKVISLENDETNFPTKSVYQKQQLPLPDPPKSSVSNSPVYSVISDKSNLNSLEQFVRTSSALSNCSSNSSKFTSYSTTSSTTNASSIASKNLPPSYGSKKQFNQLVNNFNQLTVHAKPVAVQTVGNLDSTVGHQSSRPPPPPYESILNANITTSASSNYIELMNGNNTGLTNSPQPADPPSYASSVAVLMKQKNHHQFNKPKNSQPLPPQKINRPLPPLPPLPNEKINDDFVGSSSSRTTTPIQVEIQTGPPLPPKPTKLSHQSEQQQQLQFNDELDCTAFNATSNLQLLQKRLEQHLQQQRPLVEKLKQIHLQKHQQKVLLNLKANSNASSNVNSNMPPPPSLPARNGQISNTQPSTQVKKSIASMKRPVPAPPLLPKKEHLLNKTKPKTEAVPLNTVPPVPPVASSPVDQQTNKPDKKPNEYENTPNDETANDSFQVNDETGEEEKTTHHSPIPQRKLLSKEREQERKESKVKIYSAAAYKFFMEQHIENVIKSHKQRENRKNQLENEMLKANLTNEAQLQMRKMLQQKESNYIRLKRARMEKSAFERLSTLGVGAFGKSDLRR